MTGRPATKSPATKSNPNGLQRRRRPEQGVVINRPAIKRICRRAGTKRLTREFLENVREEINDYLGRLVRDSIIYCTHFQRGTIMSRDVQYSLKRGGETLYATDTR
jgi:histone H3/H4